MVCRAFKKRTMHPPRSVAGAWDPSYSYYHDPIVVASAARFKQESPEPDGAAAAAASAALLQYSSRLAELPQLESPPLMPHQGNQRAVADGEGDPRPSSALTRSTPGRACTRNIAASSRWGRMPGTMRTRRTWRRCCSSTASGTGKPACWAAWPTLRVCTHERGNIWHPP